VHIADRADITAILLVVAGLILFAFFQVFAPTVLASVTLGQSSFWRQRSRHIRTQLTGLSASDMLWRFVFTGIRLLSMVSSPQ
jgi:hypothetical protein